MRKAQGEKREPECEHRLERKKGTVRWRSAGRKTVKSEGSRMKHRAKEGPEWAAEQRCAGGGGSSCQGKRAKGKEQKARKKQTKAEASVVRERHRRGAGNSKKKKEGAMRGKAVKRRESGEDDTGK